MGFILVIVVIWLVVVGLRAPSRARKTRAPWRFKQPDCADS